MIDTGRIEGAYVHTEEYPPGGLDYSSTLVIVERVCGDASVSKIVFTMEEAHVVFNRLQDILNSKGKEN